MSACARVRECVCLSAWVSVLNLFLETHTCAHTHSHMPELSRLWRYNGTLAYSQTNALRLVFSLSLLSWARESVREIERAIERERESEREREREREKEIQHLSSSLES